MKERKPGYAKCKGCGKKIIWAKALDGTWHPLDAVAPCFRLLGALDMFEDKGEGYELVELTCQREETTHVSHFATCPEANRFSGSKKEKAEQS